MPAMGETRMADSVGLKGNGHACAGFATPNAAHAGATGSELERGIRRAEEARIAWIRIVAIDLEELLCDLVDLLRMSLPIARLNGHGRRAPLPIHGGMP